MVDVSVDVSVDVIIDVRIDVMEDVMVDVVALSSVITAVACGVARGVAVATRVLPGSEAASELWLIRPNAILVAATSPAARTARAIGFEVRVVFMTDSQYGMGGV